MSLSLLASLSAYAPYTPPERLPIERPQDKEEQEKFYSGKQQEHTRKSQLIVLPLGQDIIDVKIGDPGPTSDINQFRERQDKFAQEQKFK